MSRPGQRCRVTQTVMNLTNLLTQVERCYIISRTIYLEWHHLLIAVRSFDPSLPHSLVTTYRHYPHVHFKSQWIKSLRSVFSIYDDSRIFGSIAVTYSFPSTIHSYYRTNEYRSKRRGVCSSAIESVVDWDSHRPPPVRFTEPPSSSSSSLFPEVPQQSQHKPRSTEGQGWNYNISPLHSLTHTPLGGHTPHWRHIVACVSVYTSLREKEI